MARLSAGGVGRDGIADAIDVDVVVADPVHLGEAHLGDLVAEGLKRILTAWWVAVRAIARRLTRIRMSSYGHFKDRQSLSWRP